MMRQFPSLCGLLSHRGAPMVRDLLSHRRSGPPMVHDLLSHCRGGSPMVHDLFVSSRCIYGTSAGSLYRMAHGLYPSHSFFSRSKMVDRMW